MRRVVRAHVLAAHDVRPRSTLLLVVLLFAFFMLFIMDLYAKAKKCVLFARSFDTAGRCSARQGV